MTLKSNIYFLVGAVCIMLTWLFVGISHDDEFHEPNLFVKHRPTLKVKFYTPIGLSDLKLTDLSIEMQKEELAYQEFVLNRGINGGSDIIAELTPPALIQLLITFFSLGVLKRKRDFAFSIWRFFLHWTICMVPTGFATILIMQS